MISSTNVLYMLIKIKFDCFKVYSYVMVNNYNNYNKYNKYNKYTYIIIHGTEYLLKKILSLKLRKNRNWEQKQNKTTQTNKTRKKDINIKQKPTTTKKQKKGFKINMI